MNDWEEAILAPEDNMEKAIQVLNAKSFQIVLMLKLVIDLQNKNTINTFMKI